MVTCFTIARYPSNAKKLNEKKKLINKKFNYLNFAELKVLISFFWIQLSVKNVFWSDWRFSYKFLFNFQLKVEELGMSWITKTWIVRTGRYWLYYTLRLEVGYQPLAVAIIDETLTPGVSSSSVCDITTPRIRFFWAAFLGTLLADFLNFDLKKKVENQVIPRYWLLLS